MSVQTTWQVLLVDDHPVYRTGLTGTLAGLHMGVRAFEAGTVKEALDLLAAHEPFDLIVYDWRLAKDRGGRRGLLALIQSAPGVPVVVLSGVEEEETRVAAEISGAADYLLKSTDPRQLREHFRRWLLRERPAPMSSTRGRQPNAAEAKPPKLTARQCEVLRGMADGSQNKEIADSLNIKPSTVRDHVSDILRLFKANNRTRAVLLAARWGLI